MSVTVQWKRNVHSSVAAYVGPVGEVVVDTTNSRLVLQDGVTAGGIPVAKVSDITAASGASATVLIGQGLSSSAAFTTISGDAIVTAGGVWTNSNINGVSYPTGPSLNTVPVVTGSLTVTYKTVPVAAGGTGISGATAHAVLVGEGTSPFNAVPIGTAGRVLTDQGAGADPSFSVVQGDATFSAGGTLVVTKTNGVAFAASATTDTTSASNISSGTLPSGRLAGGYSGVTSIGSLTGNLTLGANATGIAFNGLGVPALFGMGYVSTVAANASIATGLSSGMMFCRDQSNGGWVLFASDGGSGITIIAGSGEFVTSDPGAGTSKWWIKSGGNIENRWSTANNLSYAMFATGGGSMV